MSALAMVGRPESSISRLSDDVLYEIFIACSELWFACVFENLNKWDKEKRTAILAVCRRWRKIILASPRYWSCIKVDATMSAADIRTYIKRSGTMPLQIRFCEQYELERFHEMKLQYEDDEFIRALDAEYGPESLSSDEEDKADQSEEDEQDLLDDDYNPMTAARILATQSHRIQVLNMVGISIFTFARCIMGQFTRPAPQLLRLTFHCLDMTLVDVEDWRLMEVPFASDAPLLHALAANDLFVPWGTYATSTLTRLHFRFLADPLVSAQSVVMVLQDCTNLQILDLAFHSLLVDDTFLYQNDQCGVQLPHLRMLLLISDYDRGSRLLLSRLTYPPSTEVRLTFRYLDPFPEKSGIVRAAQEARLNVQQHFFSLKFPLPDVCITGHPLGQHARTFAALQVVSLPRLQSLVVEWTRGSVSRMNIVTSLRRELFALLSVKSLSVQYRTSAFFEHFDPKKISELVITCPQLTSLSVACIKYDPDDCLKKMSKWLLARQAAHGGIGTSLKKLEIYTHLEYLMHHEHSELPKLTNCDVVVKQCTCGQGAGSVF